MWFVFKAMSSIKKKKLGTKEKNKGRKKEMNEITRSIGMKKVKGNAYKVKNKQTEKERKKNTCKSRPVTKPC